MKLVSLVADLKGEIAEKDEEIRRLNTKSKEGLDSIWKFIRNPINMVNKAKLFDNEVKTEGQLLALKIVNVLVEFGRKMEVTLAEMWKLLSGLQPKLFRLPIPSPKDPLLKKFQNFVESMNRAPIELRTLQQHHLSKELVSEVEKVATPALVVQVKAKVVEKELETPKTKNSEPSLRKVNTRKKKEPTLESSTKTEEEGSFEDVEEVEVEDSSKELELEEEEEVEPKPETLPPEKIRIKTRTSERHKATHVLKTSVSTKRPAKGKTPKKGENSQKKPKKK